MHQQLVSGRKVMKQCLSKVAKFSLILTLFPVFLDLLRDSSSQETNFSSTPLYCMSGHYKINVIGEEGVKKNER